MRLSHCVLPALTPIHTLHVPPNVFDRPPPVDSLAPPSTDPPPFDQRPPPQSPPPSSLRSPGPASRGGHATRQPTAATAVGPDLQDPHGLKSFKKRTQRLVGEHCFKHLNINQGFGLSSASKNPSCISKAPPIPAKRHQVPIRSLVPIRLHHKRMDLHWTPCRWPRALHGPGPATSGAASASCAHRSVVGGT